MEDCYVKQQTVNYVDVNTTYFLVYVYIELTAGHTINKVTQRSSMYT